MFYFESDVWYLIGKAPYLRLAKQSSALTFLRRTCAAVESHRSTLAAYPDRRCQPLDFLYVCLESLGALDLPLFEDLLTGSTWRGVVWGAWLATLAPRPEFVEHLRRVLPGVPNNTWVVRLALAAIEGTTAEVSAEALDCAAMIRAALAQLPRPHVPLRTAPTTEELARMDHERETMRTYYVAGGADAVRAHLPGTLLERYRLPYQAWRRSLVQTD